MKGPFALLFFLTLIISTPIIIFLHELGHSTFALLFTKQEVKMFVGSYGKTTDNFNLNLGRLKIYIEPKFNWRAGLCIHHPIDETYMQLIQIFAGPALPLLIAILFYLFSDHYLSDNWIATAIFFVIFCIVSFFDNLIPRSKPITLADGSCTFNDGKLIQNSLKFFPIHKEFKIAAEYYNKKDYSNAFNHYNHLINKYRLKDKIVYNFCIYSLHITKDIDKMKDFVSQSEKLVNFNEDDLSNIGVYFSRLEDHDWAMSYYEKSLNLIENANALNNMGYSLNLLERYTEALPYFNKAIETEPDQAYAYNNRGYAKLKLGYIEEGYEDFETSNKLNPNNSYYFKNLGLYHFSKNEYTMALELFEKAKEMDVDTYKIDADIEMTKAKM